MLRPLRGVVLTLLCCSVLTPVQAEDAKGAPDLLAAVTALAEATDVERGEAAVLVLDETARLTGTVTGESVQVVTAHGAVRAPLAEVALLRGGGGVGRRMSVHLRSGEVLVGEVAAPGLHLVTPAGLAIDLAPATLEALFLPADEERDGKLPAQAQALLTTHEGTRLVVTTLDGRLTGATPWGALDLDLAALQALEYRAAEGGLPGPWLTTREGSTLPVAPSAEPLAVEATRLGSCQIAPAAIALLQRLDPAPAAAAQQPALTVCALRGGALLHGKLALDEVRVVLPAGEARLEGSRVQAIERDADAPGAACTVTLRSGDRLRGPLRRATFTLETAGGRFELPVAQVERVTLAAPQAEAPSTPEPPAPAERALPADPPTDPSTPLRPDRSRREDF